MSKLIKLFLIISAVVLPIYRIIADTPSDQVSIPSSQWEMHDGLKLATTVTTRTVGGVQKYFLRVYLKNVSTSVKEFTASGNDGGLQIYTLNDANQWVPLHDYSLIHYLGAASHTDIGPGETIHREVELSPGELALIKTHDLKVSFVIFDLTTMAKSDIESTPRLVSVEP